MEGIREYLLSVTTAAVLIAILKSLADGKSGLGNLVKVVAGLFLCYMVISPIAKVRISDISDLTQEILEEGGMAAEAGEEYYSQALRQVIIEETRAYILNKARSYGAEIEVHVSLADSEPPVPVACTISGSLSPYVRQQLEKSIINDLGIPEENITWMQ